MSTARRSACLLSLLLAVAPVSSHAQVNLAWNACLGAPTAADYVAYACDGSRDGAPFRLSMSFVLSEDVESTATLALVDIQSPYGQLPDYWQLYPGGCRESIFSASSGIDATYCGSPWPPGGFGFSSAAKAAPWGVQMQVGLANAAHLLHPGTYSAGQLQFDPILDVDNGFGSCEGCAQEICFRLRSVSLVRCCEPDYVLSGPATRDYVHWQGPTPGLCAGATPTRNRTWGAVKAIYR